MTNGTLYTFAALSPTKMLAAWLAPVCRAGSAMRVGDSYPFILITKIGGTDDPLTNTAEPVMSLHTLCEKVLGYEAAEMAADTTHRAMTELVKNADPIMMPDGSLAICDYVKVVQAQIPVDYDEVAILRWVGRYALGLSYIPIGSVSSS